MASNDHSSGDYAKGSSLGQSVDYQTPYNPALLYPIAREEYRKTLEIGREARAVAVRGFDRWHCYEVSWLDTEGKPQVAMLQIDVPAESSHIIESKSLKLYLNSLNQHRFESTDALLHTLQADLDKATACELEIELQVVGTESPAAGGSAKNYLLIDSLAISCTEYQRNPELLVIGEQRVSNERLLSHLFRSHCPVTGQPDWASLRISYSGRQLDKNSLLQYIVSYREHSGFHEQCIEQVFSDLINLGTFDELTVIGQFTRRGGIGICPCRSTSELSSIPAAINRQ